MVISLWNVADSEGTPGSVLGQRRESAVLPARPCCAQLHRLARPQRLPGNVAAFPKTAYGLLDVVEDERCVVREAKLVPVSLASWLES